MLSLKFAHAIELNNMLLIRHLLLVLSNVLLLMPMTHAFEPIILGIPDFKPFTYTENGSIKGIAVSDVNAVFKGIDTTLSIKQYGNYSLLLKALKKGEIDGFFLATKNSERDRYAVFSKAIRYNNWTWFTLKGNDINPEHSDFKYQSIVGTIGKTNTFRWLSRNGYQVKSESAEELLTALLNKDIHAAFLAEKVFENTYKEAGLSPNTFNRYIEIKRPFSIYISKTYLSANPNFMEILNSNIPEI
ncbi:MAG: polar amino acid transport system substrate-binding protein [Oceanicoccus sp.]